MSKGLKLTYKRVLKRPLQRVLKRPLQRVFKRPVPKAELIVGSPAPVESLNRFIRIGRLSVKQADKIIRHIIDAHHDIFMVLCANYEEIESKELRIVTSLYCKDYMGLTVEADILEGEWNFIQKSRYTLNKRNELYFLTAAVKAGCFGLVCKIIDEAREISVETLPSRHKIGLLRLAANKTEEDYLSWRQRLALSDLESMKAIEIDSVMGLIPCPRHHELPARILHAAPPFLHSELQTDILPFFETYKDQMVWMDCRVNQQVRADFIKSLAAPLREGRPYSLVRLGDGESYAWQDTLPQDHIRIREQRWWCSQLDPTLRQRIATQMLMAIEHADVLGIPSLFRFIRDISENRYYADHISTLGLLKVIEGLRSLPERPRSFTEDRIHQVCFDLETILDLGRVAGKVVIVSSLIPDVARRLMEPICDDTMIDCVTMPTHAKTMDNDLFASTGKSLPFVYEELNAEIAEKVGPGSLAVIAGGSIGKIFCETARAQGGVAIDVGAMADYWAGLKTRMIVDMV